MSKEHPIPVRPDAADHPQSTPGHGESIPRSPIATLVDELLGDEAVEGKDAALADVGEARRMAIWRGVEQQAEDCLSGLLSITNLLAVAATHPDMSISKQLLFALAEHLHSQSQALACWHELAEVSRTVLAAERRGW